MLGHIRQYMVVNGCVETENGDQSYLPQKQYSSTVGNCRFYNIYNLAIAFDCKNIILRRL